MHASGRGVEFLPILLPFLVLYFAPTLVGWLRKRCGQTVVVPLSLLFVLNLLLAGTGIGWILLWPLALGWTLPQPKEKSEPVPFDTYEPVFGLVPDQPMHKPAPENPTTAFEWEMPETPAPCPVCGGSGATCPSCLGSRGHWDLPQTENGVAVFVNYSYCVGSGKVQCTKCGKGAY